MKMNRLRLMLGLPLAAFWPSTGRPSRTSCRRLAGRPMRRWPRPRGALASTGSGDSRRRSTVECANSGTEGEAKAVLSIYAGAATNAAPLDSSTVARPVPAKPPAPVDPAAPGEPIKPAGN
jgi:hypothetical protein